MWYDNFLIAKKLYIDVLDTLIQVADVHFMFNPSNHDYQSGFFLADSIASWYRDCKNITFDTSIAHRNTIDTTKPYWNNARRWSKDHKTFRYLWLKKLEKIGLLQKTDMSTYITYTTRCLKTLLGLLLRLLDLLLELTPGTTERVISMHLRQLKDLFIQKGSWATT
jgi:hypothetical protein